MGRRRRTAPDRFAQKLLFIRRSLHLTQEQMVERLQSGIEEYKRTPLYPGHISEYERGKREPTLRVALEYSRLAKVPMDVLVDDFLSIHNEFFHTITEITRKRKKIEMMQKRNKIKKVPTQSSSTSAPTQITKKSNKLKKSKKLGLNKKADTKPKRGKTK